MDSRDSIDELEHAAEYVRAISILSTSGYASIAFGGINIAIGIFALQESLLNLGLVLLGAIMLATGLWNALAPSAVGIIGDGIGLLLAGLWNVIVTALALMAGVDTRPAFAILGILQIGWGVYRFVSYGRLDKAMLEEPNPKTLKRLEKLVEQIKATKASETDDLIAFRSKSLFKDQAWRGQLGTEAAIIVEKEGHDVLVAHKDDVKIKVKGKVALAKNLKATVRIGKHRLEILISPESFERYRDWKAAANEPEEVEEAEDESRDKKARPKPRRRPEE